MDQAQELDDLMERMVANYLARNRAATVLKAMLDETGVGFSPLIDHVTIRTFDIDRGAEPFVSLGYAYEETLQYADWYAKVYRKPGYPALFVDQAYSDVRGITRIIPVSVNISGDKVFHHVAARVEDIDHAVARLKQKGVVFAGNIVGAPGDHLRQLFLYP